MSDSMWNEETHLANRGYHHRQQRDTGGAVPCFGLDHHNFSWGKTVAAQDVKHTLVWQIEAFSRRYQETAGKCLESSQFCVKLDSDTTTSGHISLWRLLVLPNLKDDNLAILLRNESKRQFPVNCEFAMLDSQNKRKNERSAKYEAFPDHSKYLVFFRLQRLMEHASTLLPNDILTIICDITIAGEPKILSGCRQSSTSEILSDHKHIYNRKLLSYNEMAYKNDILSHCKLLCDGGEEFNCHRLVLSAISPVFQAMFTTTVDNLAEPLPGAVTKKVEMKGVKPGVVKSMLAFVYTGNAPDMSASEAAEQLLDLLNSTRSTS